MSLALVFAIVLFVPRADAPAVGSLDYTALATQAQTSVDVPLAAPPLPEGWHSNVAEMRTDDNGVRSWFIGFITPSNAFIALAQGIHAPERWVRERLHTTSSSETQVIDGVTWHVYDNRASANDVGNIRYALVTTAPSSTYILYGTATEPEFAILASRLQSNILAAESAP